MTAYTLSSSRTKETAVTLFFQNDVLVCVFNTAIDLNTLGMDSVLLLSTLCTDQL